MHMRIATLLVPLLVAGIVGNHVHGQATYEPYEPGSALDLLALAEEQQELIRRRGLLHVDADIQAVVDRIAANVVPMVSDDYIDFRVLLIRNPSPVSFSLADGQIYIHTGLLARLQNEAQIAAAIAHEAHHIAAHHHFRADKSRRRKGVGVGMLGIVADMVTPGGSSFSTATTTYSQAFQTRFSDEMEMEADAHAVQLIATAGYPKNAVLQVIDEMLRDPEVASPGISGSWTTVEELALRSASLEPLIGTDRSPARVPKSLVMRDLIEMTIDDYIRLNQAGAAVVWLDVLIDHKPDAYLYAAKGDAHKALGPRPNFVTTGLTKSEIRKLNLLTRAELDEKYLATAEGQERYRENTDKAVDAYTESIRLDSANSRAHAGLGELYFQNQSYRLAARHLLTYLELEPNSNDRHLVLEKLQYIRNKLREQKETIQ